MRPGFLIVRNRHTGEPMAIPTASIPREIWPETWYENAYWMHSPDRPVLEPLIKRYLEGEDLEEHEVRRLAAYVVDYACHIAIMGYLFAGGLEHAQHNIPCIRRLRALAKAASTREDLHVMIDVAMDHALDPF